jgi:hypothetical protein
MKHWTKITLIGATLLALGGLPVAAHYRAKGRLKAYKLQLQTSGEKLTAAELRPALSSAAIATAADLTAAAGGFRASYSNAPLMRLLAPGRALAACRQSELPTDESTNIWPGLDLLRAQAESPLAEVRGVLSQAPDFGFNLNYNSGANLLLPHLARIKAAAQWLSLAATVKLHEGKVSESFGDLEALTRLGVRFSQEPIMISELVRLAVAAIAINTTWEALQVPGWRDDQLQTLQALWQQVDLLTQAEAALAMERLFSEDMFSAGRQSFAGVNFQPGGTPSGLAELTEIGKQVIEDPPEGFKAALHRYPGYWAWKYWQSYEDEMLNDLVYQAGIEAARRAKAFGSINVAIDDLAGTLDHLRTRYKAGGRWLGYSAGTGLNRFLVRIRAIEMQRCLLIAAIGLKRYELKHGVYPPNLGALSPDFIDQTPRDPIDGRPLRYRLNSDGAPLLYSIGENGIDDGGDPAPPTEAPRQWWRARDAVWPWPATAEQVQTELRRARTEFQKQQTSRASGPSGLSLEFRRRYGLLPSSASQTNMGSGR